MASHFFDSVVLPRVGCVALTSLFGFHGCTRRSAYHCQNVSPAEALPGSHVKGRDLQALFWRVAPSRAREGAWKSCIFLSGILWTRVARQAWESLPREMFSVSAADEAARSSAYNYTPQCYFHCELLLKDTVKGHRRSCWSIWFSPSSFPIVPLL